MDHREPGGGRGFHHDEDHEHQRHLSSSRLSFSSEELPVRDISSSQQLQWESQLPSSIPSPIDQDKIDQFLGLAATEPPEEYARVESKSGKRSGGTAAAAAGGLLSSLLDKVRIKDPEAGGEAKDSHHKSRDHHAGGRDLAEHLSGAESCIESDSVEVVSLVRYNKTKFSSSNSHTSDKRSSSSDTNSMFNADCPSRSESPTNTMRRRRTDDPKRASYHLQQEHEEHLREDLAGTPSPFRHYSTLPRRCSAPEIDNESMIITYRGDHPHQHHQHLQHHQHQHHHTHHHQSSSPHFRSLDHLDTASQHGSVASNSSIDSEVVIRIPRGFESSSNNSGNSDLYRAMEHLQERLQHQQQQQQHHLHPHHHLRQQLQQQQQQLGGNGSRMHKSEVTAALVHIDAPPEDEQQQQQQPPHAAGMRTLAKTKPKKLPPPPPVRSKSTSTTAAAAAAAGGTQAASKQQLSVAAAASGAGGSVGTPSPLDLAPPSGPLKKTDSFEGHEEAVRSLVQAVQETRKKGAAAAAAHAATEGQHRK